MGELLPWLSLFVALVAAAAAITAAVINRGGTIRAHREPTWQQLVDRVGELEEKVDEIEKRERRKMGAVLRILAAIARQWPDAQGPDLDPKDIELIEETIPPSWIRRSQKERA